ncbi:MAG: GatB/YqeY domain-containing protein [Pseudomonadota bacterium]
MDLRTRLNAGVKSAMKAKEVERLATLRLVNAALKERDIVARSEGRGEEVGEDEILSLLAKMIKQRHESARVYEEGGRIELADKERAEITFIEAYLPKQLSEAEVEAAIAAAVEATGATSLRDMGSVMGALKAQYTGQIDFGKVGPMVKARLSS